MSPDGERRSSQRPAASGDGPAALIPLVGPLIVVTGVATALFGTRLPRPGAHGQG